jgi:hypothetical protein
LGKSYPKGDCATAWNGQPYPAWCFTNTTGQKAWGLCPSTASVQVETKKADLCSFPFSYDGTPYTECTTLAPKQRANNKEWCYVSKGVKEYAFCTAATKADTNDDCSCTCYGGRAGDTCQTCTRKSSDCPAGKFSSKLCNCDCSSAAKCKGDEKMTWQCNCVKAAANEVGAASRLGYSAPMAIIALAASWFVL